MSVRKVSLWIAWRIHPDSRTHRLVCEVEWAAPWLPRVGDSVSVADAFDARVASVWFSRDGGHVEIDLGRFATGPVSGGERAMKATRVAGLLEDGWVWSQGSAPDGFAEELQAEGG